MRPSFFKTKTSFRQWLEVNHAEKNELWVGFYKKSSNLPSISWPESVDEGLCFGWIDSIRKSIDDLSYMIRFTPRHNRSHWSAVNIKRLKELKKEGLVHPSGLGAFAKRTEKNSRRYAYEQQIVKLDQELTSRLVPMKRHRSISMGWHRQCANSISSGL